MDHRQFDGFVRSLASGTSRRQLLIRFLGLGAAAAIGAAGRDHAADAARRGYSGPSLPKPTSTPSPCQPFCGVGLCGIPNGCGGTCTCATSELCILGVCATACNPSVCEVCISDGTAQGCFWATSLTCSDNIDCQAQFGAGLCRVWEGDSKKYCFIPNNPG